MTKIAVIGSEGYVGKAMCNFFVDHYDICRYDPVNPKNQNEVIKWSGILHTIHRKYVNQCEVAVVCVPTPKADDGSCNTSIVEEVIDWVETPLIILKSTVEPGTTDRLKEKTGKNIIFQPEFCGESNYWSPYNFDKDVKETPFFIFGGDPKDTMKAVELYMPVAGPTKTYIQTDTKSAEMCKVIENSFYAVKITFFHQIYELCKKIGIDYNEVRGLFQNDPRWNPMHSAVFNDKLGYGNSCLPKDVSGLLEYSKRNGYNLTVMEAAQQYNKKVRPGLYISE